MSTVHLKIRIEAPIDRVWDTIMDPNRFGDWVTIHRAVRNVSANPRTKGATMDQVMHMPFKASTATSNFMIGVTAASGAVVYFSRGDVVRAEAPVRMNGLYVASHWPTREALEGKFSFATSYLPCPVEGAWGEWISESFTVGEQLGQIGF